MGPRARVHGGEPVELLPPDLESLPRVLGREDLSRGQQEAFDLIRSGSDVLLEAGPGVGRTALALAVAAAGAVGGGGPILLAPRRPTAGALQDALASAGHRAVRAMTPQALAHALLRHDAVGRGLGEPSLVTGAEQDALLAELISWRAEWAMQVDPRARTLPGFRTELRDLMTRAGDLGVSPADLEAMAAAHGRPAWQDAAALLRDYLGVLDLESRASLDAGPRFDSGLLVRRAAERLEQGAETPLPDLLVVDDVQDITAAGLDLILACARRGSRLLLTSCPDLAVDTFRGGLPDGAARLVERMPRPVSRVVLEEPARIAPEVRAVVDDLRSRLPLAGAAPASRRPVPGSPSLRAAGESCPDAGTAGERPVDGVATLTASGPREEARLIAAVLRDRRHSDGVDYDDMAVVCRSGAAVEQMADQLVGAGLPVHTPRRLGPLRDEAVVADLLTVVELAAASREAAPDAETADALLDPSTALRLLRGPFGDADQLRLRRVRRHLLDAARAAAADTAPEAEVGSSVPGAPESERLLARALLMEEMPGLPGPAEGDRSAAPVHRLRAMIRAARAHLEDGAPDTLWAAWDAAGLASGWQHAALAVADGTDGARARLIARRLDALVALFAAAERFAERRPQADPAVLVDHLRSQSVAEDTLAPAASVRGRVAVLTPAQIAGTHRDTVVLAGVQEGAWPNLRLRSTLFGASDLSLLHGAASGATGERGLVPGAGGAAPDAAALRAMLREQVLADEIRWAVAAVSRARRRVLVTAVDHGELAPSALHDVIAARAGEPTWLDETALRTDPGPAPDPRELVAALRRDLREDGPLARGSARLLRTLAEAGADGADPSAWYHQDPSSLEPLRDEGEQIQLSPSALEKAEECPHSWLLLRAGGSRPPAPAQLIGTALHALAERHPDPSAAQVPDLLADLETLLRPLRAAQDWSTRRRLEQAERAGQMLADHLVRASAPLAVEAPFEVDLGDVRLRGSIDRIEGDEGTLRVVDLKTGRVAKSARDAESDLQLAAYQAAIRDGALADVLGEDAPQRLAGASLVYVGTSTRSASIRTQTALGEAEDPQWFDRIVRRVAEDVSGSAVPARLNSHCDRCPVRSSCPLQPEGAEL